MPPIAALLLAALIHAIGAHIASITVAFLAATWSGAAGQATVVAVFYAPFAAVALLAPLGAGTLLRRRWSLAGPASMTLRLTTFATLLLLGELFTFALASLMASRATTGTGLVHALLATYALATTHLIHRSPVHEPLPETSEEAP